jgi:hypothetical protein
MAAACSRITKGRFHGWLFAMGLSGCLGGAVMWWLTRRSVQAVKNDPAFK